MATVEDLNTVWESRLTDLNLQLWQRMNALGVTAGWVDPLGGRPVHFTEQVNNGPERRVAYDEFFHFQVHYKGESLVDHTRHKVDYDAVVIAALVRAATMLEERGIRLM